MGWNRSLLTVVVEQMHLYVICYGKRRTMIRLEVYYNQKRILTLGGAFDLGLSSPPCSSLSLCQYRVCTGETSHSGYLRGHQRSMSVITQRFKLATLLNTPTSLPKAALSNRTASPGSHTTRERLSQVFALSEGAHLSEG